MYGALYRIALGVLLLCGSLSFCVAQDSQFSIGSIIRGFELPQTDADGNVKSKIRGDEALIISANEIRIKGLTIELFNEGQAGTVITAPECVFWKMENKLTTDHLIKIKRQGMTLTAKGMDWHLADSRGNFRNQVRVVVQSGSFRLQP